MNEPSPAGSTRTCVGCGQRADRSTLLGLFFAPVGKVSGGVVGEAGGEAFVVTLPGVGRPAGGGRGVHVHGLARCLEGASRKGLARVLRRPVRVSVAELRSGVDVALRRQVGATLRAARRQKMLSVVEVTAGPSVIEATAGPSGVGGTTDAPSLWVHAIDAGASGGREASAGQVQAGTRRQLGALVDRPEVPLIALRDRQLASRLQQACALASAVAIGGLEVG